MIVNLVIMIFMTIYVTLSNSPSMGIINDTLALHFFHYQPLEKSSNKFVGLCLIYKINVD